MIEPPDDSAARSPTGAEDPPPPPRPASLGEVAAAVLSSFFGVRKGRHMRRDAVSIRPQQVIVVGVAFAALFVLTLLGVVRLILRLAGA